MKKLLSALFLVALCSSLAMATVPDPQYCTVAPLLGPTVPTQVAFLAPGPLTGTTITITVKNNANAPINNATVLVTFNSLVKHCTTAVHTAQTNILGVCTISLRGGGCLSDIPGACVITANGIEIRNLKFVRSPDNNNHTASLPDGLVSIIDFALFGDEFNGVAPASCHDYNNDGVCNVIDFPLFGDAFNVALSCTLAL